MQLEEYLIKEAVGFSGEESAPGDDFYELEKREHINFML